MPAAVTGLFARIKDYWNAFSVPQRTFAMILVAALVLGAAVFANWVTRPQMSPVYSGLAPTDAAAITDELEAQGVNYELTTGGSTVMVPSDQVYDLRIALAAEGMPRQQDGYSLLDDMGMASSDFQQQVTFQRAMEGELALTVAAIDGINNATVHLAMPEESVFSDREEEPTASVFVDLDANMTPDANSVQAITTLVASAVPNMRTTNVSVVDAEGRDLSVTVAGGANTTDHEQRVARQVQNMLEQVIGTGNAVVSVNADLNRDSTESVSETYEAPEDVPPLSSMTVTEEYDGAGSPVGGVLGPDNIAVPGGTGEAGNYQREEETVNNSINRLTEQTVSGPGGVSRQSVSVVVDSDAASGIGADELEAMVAAAAGVDVDRGDQLAVTRAAFDTSTAIAAQEALADAEAEALAEEEAAAAQQADLLRNLLIVAAALILLMIVAALRARRRRRRAEAEEAALQALQDRPELPAPDGDTVELEAITDEAPVLEAVQPEPDADEIIRSEVAALADEDPEAVAERLREWLAVK